MKQPKPGTKGAKILALYQAGLPYSAIAAVAGVSIESVGARLSQMGVTRRKKTGQNHACEQWQVEHDPSGLFAQGNSFFSDNVVASLRASTWPIGLIFRRENKLWQVIQGDEHQELQELQGILTQAQES